MRFPGRWFSHILCSLQFNFTAGKHVCFHSGPNAELLTERHVSMTTDREMMCGTSCLHDSRF